MNALEKQVHTCKKCQSDLGQYRCHFPVYSFGKPEGKRVLVVGLNPSRNEYLPPDEFLSSSLDIAERRKSQLKYFDGEHEYKYFDKIVPFFEGVVKKILGWDKKPWECVGVLDLVKCPTVKNNRQWNELSKKEKRLFIKNCSRYLVKQLQRYQPEVVIAYGADVCRWFRDKLDLDDYIEYQVHTGNFDGFHMSVLFVHQRHGDHSLPEQKWVQRKVKKLL